MRIMTMRSLIMNGPIHIIISGVIRRLVLLRNGDRPLRPVGRCMVIRTLCRYRRLVLLKRRRVDGGCRYGTRCRRRPRARRLLYWLITLNGTRP